MNFRLLPARPALLLAALWIGMFSASAQQPAAAPPTAPMVKSIQIQYAGGSTIAKEKILANMQTRVGRAYDERTVEEDIRNLYATGNITNVRIFGEPEADGVRVIVVVQAKSQVTEVILNGVDKVKPGRIRKEISVNPATLSTKRASRPIGRRSSITTPAKASPRWTCATTSRSTTSSGPVA